MAGILRRLIWNLGGDGSLVSKMELDGQEVGDLEYEWSDGTVKCCNDLHSSVEKLCRVTRHIRCPGRRRGCPRTECRLCSVSGFALSFDAAVFGEAAVTTVCVALSGATMSGGLIMAVVSNISSWARYRISCWVIG